MYNNFELCAFAKNVHYHTHPDIIYIFNTYIHMIHKFADIHAHVIFCTQSRDLPLK